MSEQITIDYSARLKEAVGALQKVRAAPRSCRAGKVGANRRHWNWLSPARGCHGSRIVLAASP